MSAKQFVFPLRLGLCLIILSITFFGTAQPASAASIIYVNRSASGANNGTSWANAYTNLQTALSHATAGKKIWVAAGTYKPSLATDVSDPRTKTFQLKTGVAIYGGFAGTETMLSQRSPASHVTNLSGDIGAAGNVSDNAYHVVTGINVGSTALLDGFTIKSGNANGIGAPPEGLGGGVFIQNASPTLRTLVIKSNTAVSGAGMWIQDGSPSLKKIAFRSNHALNAGGGLYDYGFLSNPTLDTVTFAGNRGDAYGGGMVGDSSAAVMQYVTFSGNTAGGLLGGGGMYATDFGSTNFSNVTFSGNSTVGNGGGFYLAESGPALTNITFSGNTATNFGGGLYFTTSSGSPSLTNVTFSGNTASNGGGFYAQGGSPSFTNVTFTGNNAAALYLHNSAATVYDSILYGDTPYETWLSSSTATVVDSVVQGSLGGVTCLGTGSTCANVLTADPVLGPLQNNGGFTQTVALGANSSAIDAGDATYAGTCPAKDQRGVSRPQGAACDMGAYEVRAMTFTSQASYDGWMRESGAGTNTGTSPNSTSTQILVGDDSSNRGYRGILSFNTAGLPDGAAMVKAKLNIWSVGIGGFSPYVPLGPDLLVDLARPYFGAGPGLASNDFQAAATVSAAGTFISHVDTGTCVALLGDAGRAHINRTGTTQLRLRFSQNSNNDGVSNAVAFASANDLTPSNRPQLIVYYNP